MLAQIRRRMGFISAAEMDLLASECADQAISSGETISSIESSVESAPLSRQRKIELRRLSANKVSARLLEAAAKELGIQLSAGKCSDQCSFIVLDTMSPWHLIEEHAPHIRHPEKNFPLWHSRPYRELVDQLLKEDGLVTGMVGKIDSALAEGLESGLVERRPEKANGEVACIYRVPTSHNKAKQAGTP